MKNLKRITSLLLATAYFAGNVNAAETIHLKYGDDNYAVTPLWINMKAVEDYYMQKIDDSTWGHSPFFFARNGIIYFTKDAGIAPSTNLLAVDGLTGEFKEIMPIDWNSFTHNEVAAVYCGVDSDGTCYVASYGTASSDRYPFHIFPLEFDESGHPKVIGRYQLEFGGNDWWIKSIDVCGSLLGRFYGSIMRMEQYDDRFDPQFTHQRMPLALLAVSAGMASGICSTFDGA